MAAGGKMPAAASVARGRKLLGGSFAFSGNGATVLGDDADQDRVIGAMLNQLDASRQRNLRSVNIVANIHRAEIDGEEFRQIFGQALHFNFGLNMVDQAAIEPDAFAGFFVDEMQWHHDVQFVGGIDALKINVQNEWLVSVDLCVTQQNLLFFAINHQIDDGGVESFFFQLEQHVVVVDFKRLGGGFATVYDTGDFGRTTQAAARTRSLQCARLRN